MFNELSFRLKRLRFIASLSRSERKKYCLRHFQEKGHHDVGGGRYIDREYGCADCMAKERLDRTRVERGMAYYNMALRDRELADELAAAGQLEIPQEVPHPRIAMAGQQDFVEELYGPEPTQPAGDFVPDGNAPMPDVPGMVGAF
jgi:hypothetical protein